MRQIYRTSSEADRCCSPRHSGLSPASTRHSVGSKNSSEHFGRSNQVLRHQTRSSRISKMSPNWKTATRKSQLCKPSTFQYRLRILLCSPVPTLAESLSIDTQFAFDRRWRQQHAEDLCAAEGCESRSPSEPDTNSQKRDIWWG